MKQHYRFICLLMKSNEDLWSISFLCRQVKISIAINEFWHKWKLIICHYSYISTIDQIQKNPWKVQQVCFWATNMTNRSNLLMLYNKSLKNSKPLQYLNSIWSESKNKLFLAHQIRKTFPNDFPKITMLYKDWHQSWSDWINNSISSSIPIWMLTNWIVSSKTGCTSSTIAVN